MKIKVQSTFEVDDARELTELYEVEAEWSLYDDHHDLEQVKITNSTLTVPEFKKLMISKADAERFDEELESALYRALKNKIYNREENSALLKEED